MNRAMAHKHLALLNEPCIACSVKRKSDTNYDEPPLWMAAMFTIGAALLFGALVLAVLVAAK